MLPIDVDLATPQGVLIVVGLLAIGYLWLVSGGFTLLVGVTLIALVLAAVYYVGIRVDRWLAGRRGRSR